MTLQPKPSAKEASVAEADDADAIRGKKVEFGNISIGVAVYNTREKDIVDSIGNRTGEDANAERITSRVSAAPKSLYVNDI